MPVYISHASYPAFYSLISAIDHPRTRALNSTMLSNIHFCLLGTLVKLAGTSPVQREERRQSRLGRTTLHLAAVRGDVASAKRTIERHFPSRSQWGANIGIELHGRPLRLERERRETILDMFPFVGDRDGMTPLHEATIRGHREIVDMFLKLESIHNIVDLPDHQGRTALHWATALEKTEIAQLLINAGADCSKRDRWGAMAVSRALGESGGSPMPLYFQNFTQVEGAINRLLDNNEVGPAIFLLRATRDYGHNDYFPGSHTSTNNNVPSDFWTVMKDNWTWFNEHWKDPASANSKDENGKTLLTHAVEGNCEAVVRLLCAIESVDVNSVDERGWTPLLYAADRGLKDVVKHLVATEEIDVNLRDQEGRTPLSHAAGNGEVAVVKQLLDTEKAEVDPKDNDNRTPLSYAAENGHTAVAELLDATGEDLDKRAKSKSDGKDPYLYAAGRRIPNATLLFLLRVAPA